MDLIERQAAIDALKKSRFPGASYIDTGILIALQEIKAVPSAQPERDIPKKPTATIDRAWGIPHRQAVCPECDYYLGQVHFICEGDKRKVTYCESCGQAIDWEGWDFDG